MVNKPSIRSNLMYMSIPTALVVLVAVFVATFSIGYFQPEYLEYVVLIAIAYLVLELTTWVWSKRAQNYRVVKFAFLFVALIVSAEIAGRYVVDVFPVLNQLSVFQYDLIASLIVVLLCIPLLRTSMRNP